MFRLALFRLVWLGLAIGLVAFAVVGEQARGEVFVVGVAEVKDGDSLLVGGEKIRLLGIDAPEYGQLCGEGQDLWNCGEAAKDFLEALVQGDEVRCSLMFRDAHHRWLAMCSAGGRDLAREMVSGGMALALSKEYRASMEEARRERKGIWRGCLEKPDKWRQGRRECWFT